MTNAKRIRLFYDNHCYETEIIDIYISPVMVCLTEDTYEHGDGGAYGLKHVLDAKNSVKFMVHMASGGRNPYKTITELFSGSDGARKFRAFCEEHHIKYTSSV